MKESGLEDIININKEWDIASACGQMTGKNKSQEEEKERMHIFNNLLSKKAFILLDLYMLILTSYIIFRKNKCYKIQFR